MARKEFNIDAKIIFAKILSEENISVIFDPAAKTAAFDVKGRQMILPEFKHFNNFVTNMLIGHETGHALFTPSDALKYMKNVPKSYVNIVEDARIERKIKMRYKGLRPTFTKAYNYLHKEIDFFGLRNLGGDKYKELVNQMSFIDRINLHFKMGDFFNVIFNDIEQEIVDDIAICDTFIDAVDLARKVFEMNDTKMHDQPTTEPGMPGNEISDSMESDDSDAPAVPEESGDEDDPSNESSDSSADGSPDDDSDDEELESSSTGSDDEPESDIDGLCESETETDEDDENTSDSEQSGDGCSSDGGGIDPKKSITDEASQKALDSLRITKSQYPARTIMPLYNTKRYVKHWPEVLKSARRVSKKEIEGASGDRIRESMKEFKNDSRKTIAYMAKEFEMRKRAAEYLKTTDARSGEIDPLKLHSYKYTDEIFLKKSIVPVGKSHGLTMLIDWSGSMGGNLTGIASQLFNIVWFCKKVNIPFEIYTFTAGRDWYGDRPSGSDEERDSRMPDGSWKPSRINLRMLNILSSRMKNKEYQFMSTLLWGLCHGTLTSSPKDFRMAGTPFNEALAIFNTIAHNFKVDNRLDFVNSIIITDGDGVSFSKVTGAKQYVDANNFVVTDIVTKKMAYIDEDMKKESYYSKEVQAGLFMKNLKNRTGGHVIGYFITGSALPNEAHMPEDSEKYAESKKIFNKTGICLGERFGYDEYFVINREALQVRSNGGEIKKGTSNEVSAILTARLKVRKESRVFLKRFIELIT